MMSKGVDFSLFCRLIARMRAVHAWRECMYE